MRSVVVVGLFLAACAGESGGGAPPPHTKDWYRRHPDDLTSAGPVTLDATTPRFAVRLRSALTLTTSPLTEPSELIGMKVNAEFTRAKVRLRVYPEGGDPTAAGPYATSEVGNVTSAASKFEDDVFTYSFRDCPDPCVRTEDYTFDVELLEGPSTTFTWYVHSGVRLLVDPAADVKVPAPDETFTLEVVPDP